MGRTSIKFKPDERAKVIGTGQIVTVKARLGPVDDGISGRRYTVREVDGWYYEDSLEAIDTQVIGSADWRRGRRGA